MQCSTFCSMESGGQSRHQNMPVLYYRYRSYVFVFQLISLSCFNSGVGWRVKVLGMWRPVLPCVGRIQRAHYYRSVKSSRLHQTYLKMPYNKLVCSVIHPGFFKDTKMTIIMLRPASLRLTTETKYTGSLVVKSIIYVHGFNFSDRNLKGQKMFH